MNNKLLEKKTDKLGYFAPAAFLFAGLMPEYVAPFFTAVGFFAVLRNRIANKSGIRFGIIGINLAVLIGWITIGLFYSSSAISALASIGLWLLMFMGYFLFTETVDSPEKIDRVMFCGGLSAGIAGIIGVGQMFLYHFSPAVSKIFNPFWRCLNMLAEKLVLILPEFIKSSMPSMTFHSFDTRACSTFTNPLFFATIEVVLLPFAAYVFLCSESRKRRIIGFFCLICTIGGIACSYSRGPYLFAVIVFGILLLYGFKKGLKLAAVGGVSLGALFIFARGIFKRLLTLLSGKDISVNTRIDILGSVFDIIHKKPIFGYGTGFDNTRQLLHEVYNIRQPHAHNIFLEIWVENGIFGVILLAAVFIIAVIGTLRLLKRGGKAREFGVTLLASVIGFILCGMTDCIFYGLKPLQYLMMILGLTQAAFTIYLKKTTEE